MDKTIKIEKEMVVCVTYTDCIQVGIEQWRNKSVSKIFYGADQLNDIIKWCKAMNLKFDWSQLTFTNIVE
jgi:hypothetical protein